MPRIVAARLSIDGGRNVNTSPIRAGGNLDRTK
jgi:hypothetical protein